MNPARKAIWFAASVFFVCAGCRRAATPVFSSVVGPSVRCSQGSNYFPSSIGGSAPLNLGADQAKWESMYLRHMGEPSLYHCAKPGTGAALRFLWDRSLSSPIAARLVIHPNRTGTLYLHMLAHATRPPAPAPGGKSVSSDDWYRQTLCRQKSITREQVNRVVRMVNEIHFATDHSVPQMNDGSDWIFEIEEAGHYRVVDFRNKPPDVARKLGLFLVTDLGGITLDSRAIY